MAGLSRLEPYQIKYTFLCMRWAVLKSEIGQLKEQILDGKGSSYLFLKLQEMVEEYDQLNPLLVEINRLDKALIKKLKAA